MALCLRFALRRMRGGKKKEKKMDKSSAAATHYCTHTYTFSFFTLSLRQTHTHGQKRGYFPGYGLWDGLTPRNVPFFNNLPAIRFVLFFSLL